MLFVQSYCGNSVQTILILPSSEVVSEVQEHIKSAEKTHIKTSKNLFFIIYNPLRIVKMRIILKFELLVYYNTFFESVNGFHKIVT